MTPHVFKRSLWLPYTPEQVFQFFERPDNLKRLTPLDLGFTMLTPAVKMRSGAVMDYSIRLVGMPVRWTTFIDDYDPPRSFSDVQLRGPYSFWHHTHCFVPSEGGTLMTDEVRYLLPLEPLTTWTRPLVDWQLRRIFDFRAKAIELIFPPRAGAHP
jgi:ligand-binding SRPBCC domain-containing protein